MSGHNNKDKDEAKKKLESQSPICRVIINNRSKSIYTIEMSQSPICRVIIIEKDINVNSYYKSQSPICRVIMIIIAGHYKTTV